MARPRRQQQDVVLDGIARALATRTELRPWTLADVAPFAGLSPAGLVKRFGSRRGIIVALSRRWIDAVPGAPDPRRRPWDELREWAVLRFGAEDGTVPAALGQLVDELADPELRTLLDEGWTRERAYLAALLAEAGLPRLGDPVAAADVLFDALTGAAIRAAAGSRPPAAGPPAASDPVRRTLDTMEEAWT
ncbi:hypothetical protein [Mycetocola reblochoni]|uniref:hypothetical protein n=1 Tax=Mycetocola reblochoni TaxID=331618 RepID=UPI0011C48F45|nr:hypothetical protein [Mycetocola reblochoni]